MADIKHDELTFDYAQLNQPWSIEYADRHKHDVSTFRSPFMVNHCLLHIVKATGKIARVLEETDHSNVGPVPSDENIKVIVFACADIVASCMKICTVYGGYLSDALMRRVKEKNGKGYNG